MTLKTIERWGVAFGIILGTLLHFTYEWSAKATVVGFFSATNESVWEHTKLFFFPMLVFAILEWKYVQDKRTLLFAKVIESFTGILFIICFFYTYTSALGISPFLPVDIVSFFIAVALGKYISYKIINGSCLKNWHMPLVINALILLALTAGFFYVTQRPPQIPLFVPEDEAASPSLDLQLQAIESQFPNFKNFESQKSFAGTSIKKIQEGADSYFAFETLGSGVPIATATCFRVDKMNRVYKVGEFPQPIDQVAGYADIDPKTCNGIL